MMSQRKLEVKQLLDQSIDRGVREEVVSDALDRFVRQESELERKKCSGGILHSILICRRTGQPLLHNGLQ